MRPYKAILWGVVAVLVLILIVSFAQEAKAPKPACEDQASSVCTVADQCPDGYFASDDFACFALEYTCCVPA